MNTRQELILRAVSSFIEDNNFAYFTYSNFSEICKNVLLKQTLKELEELNCIKDISKNGYAKKIEVLHKLDCPDFLWNSKLPIKLKEYLLDLYKCLENKLPLNNYNIIKDKRLAALGFDRDKILNNSKPVTKKISASGELIKDNNGYRVISRVAKLERKCIYCGTTEESEFDNSSKTICRECKKKLLREEISLEERLYRRSKQNAHSIKAKYELDILYIKQLLESQKYKCKYSGITFENNFHNKLTYPTIDRIDSSKGYIKGNVCICTYMVNIMKHNLELSEFKGLITKIYNNINNF